MTEEIETLDLDIEMLPDYKKAVKILNNRGISINSIEVIEHENIFTLEIKPTHIHYLYDIFFNMGISYINRQYEKRTK